MLKKEKRKRIKIKHINFINQKLTHVQSNKFNGTTKSCRNDSKLKENKNKRKKAQQMGMWGGRIKSIRGGFLANKIKQIKKVKISNIFNHKSKQLKICCFFSLNIAYRIYIQFKIDEKTKKNYIQNINGICFV